MMTQGDCNVINTHSGPERVSLRVSKMMLSKLMGMASVRECGMLCLLFS
jgi:hypothetical protein